MASKKIDKLVLEVTADQAQHAKELLKAEKDAKAFAKTEEAAMQKARVAADKYAKSQKKSMLAARKAMKDFDTQTIRTMKRSGVAIAAMAAVTGAAMSALFVTTSNYADLLGKTSDKLGIFTDAMEGLRYRAQLTGVATTGLDVGLQRMARRLSEVEKTGAGQAKRAIDELGISIDDLAGKGVDEQFKLIATAFEDIDKQSDRVRLAFALFDTEGVNLVNTMKGGAKAIQAAQDEAVKLGIALSRADVAQFEMANDAITRMQAAIKGAGNTMSAALAPYVAALATDFADAAVESQGFSVAVSSAMTSAIQAVAAFADAIYGVRLAYTAIRVYSLEVVDTFVGGFAKMSKAEDDFRKRLTGWLPEFRSEAAIQQEEAAHKQALKRAGEVAEQLKAAQKDALELSDPGAPGKRMIARAKKIAEEAQIAADKVAKERKKRIGQSAAGDTGVDLNLGITQAQLNAEVELFKDKSSQLYEIKLQENNKLVDLEQYRHGRALAEAQKEYDLLIERGAVKEDIEKAHLDRIENLNILNEKRRRRAIKQETGDIKDAANFKKASFTSQTKHIVGELVSLTSGVAQHSKSMFKINKIAGIANAIISTQAGAAKSLEVYPWPLAGVMAGLHYAAGMARVAAIKKTTFGGGGGGTTPSSAGVAPVVNDATVAQPLPQPQTEKQEPDMYVFIEGEGQLQGDDIINLIQDRFKNRDQVVITSGTAQMEEIKRSIRGAA